MNDTMRQWITLVERMENPLPWRWVIEQPKVYRAEFEKDGITYWVHCYPSHWDGNPIWMFDFGITKESAEARGDTSLTAPTGYSRGGAMWIVSTVKAIFDDFIASHRPKIIVFYDSDHVASRSRMYEYYAEYLQRRWGYERDDAMVAKTARSTNTRIWALRKT